MNRRLPARRRPPFVMRLILLSALLSTLVLAPARPALAAAGEFDPTFGLGGKVATGLGVYHGTAVALQADGKILAAGTRGVAPARDVVVARYHGDGALDAAFGTGGVLTGDLGGDDRAVDVAVQADGRILVAGTTDGDLALARYRADGTPDPAFGASGLVTTDLLGQAESRALVLQPDGKIVVAGYVEEAGIPSFFVARYRGDGSLDPAFGSGGVVTTAAGQARASDVALQADGKIVVAGYQVSTAFSFVLARYDAGGSLDLGFGTGGLVVTEAGTGWEPYTGTAVAVQSDGKIVVAGGAYTGLALARYQASGALDPTFGTGGQVFTDAGAFERSWATDLLIQPDGRLVVAGVVGILSELDLALARYLTSGVLDDTFGSGGTVIADLGGNEYDAPTIALQVDGKIVAAGDNGSDLLLARFQGDSGEKMPSPQPPDPDGWTVRFPSGYSILADDWQCGQTGPVDEISLWLAWRGDEVSSLGKVSVAIWSNDPGPPTQPLSALWSGEFDPGDYTLKLYGSGDQGFYDPNPASPLVLPNDHWNYYQLTIPSIPDAFVQQQGETYWLVLFVFPDFAWHGLQTADGSLLSPAMYMSNGWTPLADPLSGAPLDLAFVIGSTPDPVCQATIRSVHGGSWTDPDTWDLGRVPHAGDLVLVQSGHTVVIPDQVDVAGLCNFGSIRGRENNPLAIHASGAVSNHGQILGGAGPDGAGAGCGGPGGDVEIQGSPIYNGGTIQAGAGGAGPGCAGRGGNTMILGRNTTNEGTICAGRGGDLLDPGARATAGAGGETHLWGKWGGAGALVNRGLACGGDGGDAHPGATVPQNGGAGGRLKLISLPSVYLDGGRHYAGRGGLGAGGGSTGRDGQIVIEPLTISLSGPGTELWGGDLLIFGGDDWVLDLSTMDSAAISSTGNITLAVGTGGVVDLGGNADRVLHAAGQVTIASDTIVLEPGVTLSDVAGDNAATAPSAILSDFSLLGPAEDGGWAGANVPLPLVLLNGGPAPDTYDLSCVDAAGWTLDGLPPSLAVPALDGAWLTPTLAIPSTARFGAVDVVTVTATSQNDPARVEVHQVQVTVRSAVYLPLILRDAAP